jgi:hypothetical protein
MKEWETKAFSGSRRRFLGGSVAVAALSALPLVALAGRAVGESEGPRLWLASFDQQADLWRPVALATSLDRSAPGPLRLTVRGPWALAGSVPESLVIEVVYRHAQAPPFALCSGLRSPGQGGVRLHAEATAVSALQARFGTGSTAMAARCPLTTDLLPSLAPGRYAVLIDPEGRMAAPNWAQIRMDDGGQLDLDGSAASPLAGLVMDIASA